MGQLQGEQGASPQWGLRSVDRDSVELSGSADQSSRQSKSQPGVPTFCPPASSPRLGTYRSAQPGNGSWMHSPLSGPQVSCWALLGRHTVLPTPSPVGSCSSDGLPCRPEKDTQSQGMGSRTGTSAGLELGQLCFGLKMCVISPPKDPASALRPEL